MTSKKATRPVKNESIYDPNRPNTPATTPVKRAATKAEAADAPKEIDRIDRSPLPRHERLEVQSGQADLTADAALAPGLDDHDQLKKDIERIRGLRKPFGTFTQKLALAIRPGYQRHWFNDEPGRVDEAASAGWAHVKDKDDKPVRRVVGRGRDSGALYAYAMELPKIFWDEDMRNRHEAAQARIDEIKKSPFRAKPGQAKSSDADKFYSAREEPVAITQSTMRRTTAA